MDRELEPPRISVIIPLYNEEENVLPLLERLFPVLEGLREPFEVVCVDDGSTDRTVALLAAEAARRGRLRLLRKPRNEGQHAAVIEGFRAARGEWVVTLDADLQNPPEEIPRLVELLRRGHDVVGTYRDGRRDGRVRRLASRAANRLVSALGGVAARDIGCMLRGYSREIAHAVAREAAGGVFVPLAAARLAANPAEIPVRHERRAGGRSKYGVLRLAGLAMRLARS